MMGHWGLSVFYLALVAGVCWYIVKSEGSK